MIYPKIDERLNGIDSVKKYIEKSGGVEIQFFHNDGIWGNYNIISIVDKLMNYIPSIKEITIHPPLQDYEIETVILENIDIINKTLDETVILSRKYNIKINMLYHVGWPITKLEHGVLNCISELVKRIENTNVQIVIENIYSINEYKKCTVLEVCKMINNNHLKACLDICHIHCLANMFKEENFSSFLDKYIDKELAEKYIYQIHFSATKNNDGYIDVNTHSRKHNNIQDLMKDYSILEKFNLTSKIIITEIIEDNYLKRNEQIEEIEMLNNI